MDKMENGEFVDSWISFLRKRKAGIKESLDMVNKLRQSSKFFYHNSTLKIFEDQLRQKYVEGLHSEWAVNGNGQFADKTEPYTYFHDLFTLIIDCMLQNMDYEEGSDYGELLYYIPSEDDFNVERIMNNIDRYEENKENVKKSAQMEKIVEHILELFKKKFNSSYLAFIDTFDYRKYPHQEVYPKYDGLHPEPTERDVDHDKLYKILKNKVLRSMFDELNTFYTSKLSGGISPKRRTKRTSKLSPKRTSKRSNRSRSPKGPKRPKRKV